MDCLPIPQFSHNFLLRLKTYLKECPPSASITNRDFPLSSKHKHVGANYAGANYAAAQWFILVQGA